MSSLSNPALPGRRRVRSRGLTLIEVTLVIGLVAVLATLALSGWNGWRKRIHNSQAQADIIAISAVIDQFFADKESFPASLAAIGRGDMKDPWGNAYVYVDLTTAKGNGKARKDHSLVPLNSDYDLYSKGADGKSASALTAESSKDDILRANNGRFVGLGADY